MTDKQQQLLQLIEELQLPIFSVVARAHVEKLNDEEVGMMLELYHDVKNYQNTISESAQQSNEAESQAAEEKLMQDQLTLKQKLSQKLERLQERADQRLDKQDGEWRHQLTALLHKQQLQLQDLEDEHKQMYSKLSVAAMGGNKT